MNSYISVLLLLSPALAHVSVASRAVRGRTSLQTTNSNSTATAAAASPPYSANCTAPRLLQESTEPFCFIPDTASPGAKKFLSHSAASNVPWSSYLKNSSALAGLRDSAGLGYAAISINSSSTAATFLQSTRNDTIAGVPVVFGVPKGASSNARPAETKLLMYLHGGGYAVGSCHYQMSTAVPTAARAGLTILCVEYRLAPEHPFPAGLNDILAVYKDLLKQGYRAKNIALLGDSAGGDLVAAVTIRLQQQGVQLPAALGMFSPWTDPDPSVQFDTQVTLIGVDPVIAAGPNGLGALGMAYVGGNVTLFSNPLVSPRHADWAQIFAGDKLPPTLIQVGLRESLLSQVTQLYHNMKKAVSSPGHVTISPYDVMWHVFQAAVALPEAIAAHEEMADFFFRAVNGTLCAA